MSSTTPKLLNCFCLESSAGMCRSIGCAPRDLFDALHAIGPEPSLALDDVLFYSPDAVLSVAAWIISNGRPNTIVISNPDLASAAQRVLAEIAKQAQAQAETVSRN